MNSVLGTAIVYCILNLIILVIAIAVIEGVIIHRSRVRTGIMLIKNFAHFLHKDADISFRILRFIAYFKILYL